MDGLMSEVWSKSMTFTPDFMGVVTVPVAMVLGTGLGVTVPRAALDAGPWVFIVVMPTDCDWPCGLPNIAT